MIEEPPLLTVKRSIRRPTRAQLDAFADAPTSVVADAMGGRGALDTAIKPLPGVPDRAVGSALTADNGPGDALAVFAALAYVAPGDIVVSAHQGHLGCASIGDRFAGMLKNAGGVAVVSDAPVRDQVGIAAVGLPCWSSGLNPASPYTNGPGWVGLPIQIGGQTVASGDVIVADRDGVVVVPFDEIDPVAERVRQTLALEAELDAKIAAGQRSLAKVDDVLQGPRVRFVD